MPVVSAQQRHLESRPFAAARLVSPKHRSSALESALPAAELSSVCHLAFRPVVERPLRAARRVCRAERAPWPPLLHASVVEFAFHACDREPASYALMEEVSVDVALTHRPSVAKVSLTDFWRVEMMPAGREAVSARRASLTTATWEAVAAMALQLRAPQLPSI